MENNVVFVTGVSGFLGTNLVNSLIEEGFKVKALLRNVFSYKGVRHSNLELIQGQLSDNLVPYLKTTHVFIHVAAETNQSLLNYSDYRKINVEATQYLLQSCINCGVKRFIYISSANTLGYGSIIDPGNEKKQMRMPFVKSFYAQSKLDAEEYLLSQTDKIDVVILNPTFMIGAYDSKPGSGKIILMALKKKIVLYPPGGKNFVDVKDVAQGIIHSIENGRSGEKYILANENLSYAEFFNKLNVISTQKTIMIKVPQWLLITIGLLGDLLRKMKIETSFNSVNLQMLCINNFFSNEKSKRELKLNYRKIENAISDAIDYYKNNSL